MKKIKMLSMFLFITIFMFSISGCSGKPLGDSKEEEKNMFYLYGKENGEVYTLNENIEKEKLASQVQDIFYIDVLQSYAELDSDNNLYLLDNQGQKDKISSDVSKNINVSNNGNIYFTTNDGGLYKKAKDKEKEKIAENVSEYKLINDGDNIIYKDKDENSYIKKADQDKIKVASNVNDIKLNNDESIVAYISDNTLYLKDLAKDDKEKVAEKYNNGSLTFIDNKKILYMDDYNLQKGKGELYIKEFGQDKRKIASDVKYAQADIKGVYYITDDNTFNYKKYDSDDKAKILDDAKEITSNANNMYVLDKDKNIYKINEKNEKEKVVQDASDYNVTKNNLVTLNKENELLFDNTKIGEDVIKFVVSGSDIAFINKSNEVYLSKNGSESEKVISDAKEYSKIKFNNYELFVNKMEVSDITGQWKAVNKQTNEAIYLKFDNEKNIYALAFDKPEEKHQYTIDYSDENVINLTSEDEKIELNKDENGKLNIRFSDKTVASFESVSSDEYNNIKSLVEKLYPLATGIFGSNLVFFSNIETIDGVTYYAYNTKEGDQSTGVYFDADGNKFTKTNSGLKPYVTLEKSSEDQYEKNDTFTQENATKYAKTYCDNKYGDNAGIRLSVGSKEYENGKAYFNVKLTSIAAASQGGTGTMGWLKVYEDGNVMEK
ncbi:UNVERIFIED_ORG: hypothetical protein B2H95_05680 [Clostridium botulinum]|uniref:hypothetical protein n=1 Tax=Clostridium sp. ZBS15 TaxID=2949969 RepID=UPI000A175AF8|nr:hypothetical protein [Clostridium sp. ZBS15]